MNNGPPRPSPGFGDVITELDTPSCPPISNNLYPAPANITTVFVDRNPGDVLGIEFKNIAPTTVIVSGVVEDSIISRTDMKPGHEILTVNGEPITTSGQLSQIIRRNRRLEFKLCDPIVNRNPFCYVEIISNSMENPGVSFERCCNDTMVMIGHVFISDLTKTRLQTGDLVLAVNGVPVWQPEQAREVQIRAAMKSEPFVFYCINMEELRDFFISQIPENLEIISVLSKKNIKMQIRKIDPFTITIMDENSRGCYRVKVNRMTQLYEFECREGNVDGETLFLMTSKTSNWILDALNTLMEQQLQILKTNIVTSAWKATLVMRRNTIVLDDMLSSVVAVASQHELGRNSNHSTSTHEIPVVEAVPVHESVAL